MKKIVIVSVVVIVAVAIYFAVRPQQRAAQQQITPGQQKQAQSTQGATAVVIKNFAFNPDPITVKVGDTVTWTNQDGTIHSIKSATFNSQTLATGQTFSFTFKTPGTYDYSCGIHPSMQGKVIVQ